MWNPNQNLSVLSFAVETEQDVHHDWKSQKQNVGGTVQFSSVQFSSVQLSSVQFSSVHLILGQLSSVQFGSSQFSSAQFSSVQFSSVHLSSVQLSSSQFSSAQFSSCELKVVSKRSGSPVSQKCPQSNVASLNFPPPHPLNPPPLYPPPPMLPFEACSSHWFVCWT